MHQKVSDAYPELTHYTSASGLKGILESQCLWASHARFLNDAKEIDYFFEARCTALITGAISDGLRAGKLLYEGQPPGSRLQAALNDAVRAAAELTSAVRTTTLTFNQPYLLSLCGTSDPRVMRDGLLSQWRAYGRDGGYALVLDAKRLEDRLEAEAAAFHYQHGQIGNVYYHDEDGTSDTPEPEIREAEASLRAGVLRYYQDPRPETLEDFYIAVTTLCCLYKHWSFHEEHEVRVVAIPAHASLVEETAKQAATRPPKQIKTFLRRWVPRTVHRAPRAHLEWGAQGPASNKGGYSSDHIAMRNAVGQQSLTCSTSMVLSARLRCLELPSLATSSDG